MTQPLDSGIEPSRDPSPRKSTRIRLDAEVRLRQTGHGTYRAKIFDVSAHGCKAEFIERPQLDGVMWLKFDGLDSLEASVCWIRGFEVGLEFTRPIHPAVFEMLVAKLNG